MTHDFKIIAIRPLLGCNHKFLKALQKDIFYQFCNDFTINKKEIKYTPSYPEQLFHVNHIAVNISAIAGKNGSAKSSLIELLFAGLYNLAINEQILIPQANPDAEDKDERAIPAPPESVFFDFYYKIDDKIYLIEFRDQQLNYHEFCNDKADKSIYYLNPTQPLYFEHMEFFYAIVINYSFYALNTKELGNWLRLLFHKNDSYQTPVVINPLRTRGNININRENELVQSRLLYNLLKPIKVKPEESLRNLAPGKTARSLTLELDDKKFKDNTPLFAGTPGPFVLLPYMKEVIYAFFEKDVVPENNVWNQYAQNYILKKLKSITETYKSYTSFQKIFTVENLLLPTEMLAARAEEKRLWMIEYLTALLIDSSHITFKLRRAVYFLFYNFIPKTGGLQTVSIEDLSKSIIEYSVTSGIPILELLPPSFLKSDILFDQGSFNQLSSGEKQKIYSTYSVIYHLINLNSIKKDLFRYHHVSCIFDEIELYYHPELQRTFIFDFLATLKKTELPEIWSINFTFITHSPFILSDIPKSNILYLAVNDKGEARPEKVNLNTFGANIYDLLANSFFFKKGFMGELATKKIQQVIENLNDNTSEEYPLMKLEEMKVVIKMIGEPFLKQKLMLTLETKFKDDELRLNRIQRLQDEIDDLKNFQA